MAHVAVGLKYLRRDKERLRYFRWISANGHVRDVQKPPRGEIVGHVHQHLLKDRYGFTRPSLTHMDSAAFDWEDARLAGMVGHAVFLLAEAKIRGGLKQAVLSNRPPPCNLIVLSQQLVET